ncbi:MAG: hypothetical protein ACOYM3_13035 [Terrimicrobiaceae bacterium]
MKIALRPSWICGVLFIIACCVPQPVRAVIVYGKTNLENTTNPGIGSVWDSVVTLAKPDQTFNASGVYLGGGVFLTAEHVDADKGVTQIKINGALYDLDPSFGIKGRKTISGVDLQVFKVLLPPILPSVSLNTDGLLDINRFSVLVGTGLGKGSEVVDQGWNWGNDLTYAKRWGTNYTLDAIDSAYLSSIYGYSTLGSAFYAGYGADTGTVTMGDSGSALFQFIGGTWVLSGVTTSVQVGGSSFYNRGPTSPVPSPDYSVYVRVSDYAGSIQAAIPEPGSFSLTIAGAAALVLLVKRTRKLRI